jgi:hypothetical protein
MLISLATEELLLLTPSPTNPSKLNAGQLIAVTAATCPQLPVQSRDEPLILVPLRDLQFQLQVFVIQSMHA